MTGWDRSPGPDNDYASAQRTSSVWSGILVMVLVLFAAGLVIGWLLSSRRPSPPEQRDRTDPERMQILGIRSGTMGLWCHERSRCIKKWKLQSLSETMAPVAGSIPLKGWSIIRYGARRVDRSLCRKRRLDCRTGCASPYKDGRCRSISVASSSTRPTPIKSERAIRKSIRCRGRRTMPLSCRAISPKRSWADFGYCDYVPVLSARASASRPCRPVHEQTDLHPDR